MISVFGKPNELHLPLSTSIELPEEIKGDINAMNEYYESHCNNVIIMPQETIDAKNPPDFTPFEEVLNLSSSIDDKSGICDYVANCVNAMPEIEATLIKISEIQATNSNWRAIMLAKDLLLKLNGFNNVE